jgi:hypothetical protein
VPKKPPPGCGLDLNSRVLYHPYMHGPGGFHDSRKLRKCVKCGQVVTQTWGTLDCPVCAFKHQSNETFLRLFKSLHLRAGRRSAKTHGGAHAVRDELAIPKQRWWACAPSFKILHDSTEPTLLRLIPPSWVKDWSQEHHELLFWNGSLLQFRSLDDPERGRGPGLNGAWLDEAAFIQKKGWDVLSPSLTENLGITISTTSPDSFDWTYDEFLVPALIDPLPGYWAARFHTLDNPMFRESLALQREVEEKRIKWKDNPDFFKQEFEGEDVNATDSIYGSAIDSQVLV